MNYISFFLIKIIKFYKYFISPILGNNCRYFPTCSDYFAECIKLNGVLKGSFFGFKRILSCHPIKILGGGCGFDPATKLKTKK